MRNSSDLARHLEGPEVEQAGAFEPGAPAAFEQLYRSHFGFTWRVLGHLGVPQAALDDAVQEVWLIVHRRLDAFEARSSLKTWLFGIALNVARNQRRGDDRRARRLERMSAGEAPPDPETLRARREALERVQRYTSTLDEQLRAIFVCNLIENLSALETAEAVGTDVTTVYKRVRALRSSFKSWLARELGEEGGRRP